MAMLLALVESTRGRPGVENLRYAVEERACLMVAKAVAWVGPKGSVLGLPVRSQRGCSVWKEVVIAIHRPYKLL